jgi:hypothetical protein
MGQRRNRSSGVIVSVVLGSDPFVLSYTRLSRAASEDQGDRSTFAVNNVVAGAATRATSEAELALLDWRSHGDRSCVEHVREGSGVLHLGGDGSDKFVEGGSGCSRERNKTPGLCRRRISESVVMDD